MKSIIIILILLSTQLVFGQFSYTESQHFMVGDVIHYRVSNVVDPSLDFEQAGEDVSWDFQDFAFTRMDTVTFIDPEDSGYKAPFCLTNFYLFNCQSKFDELTNLAIRSADSLGFGEIQTENVVRHLRVADGKYEETMIGVTAMINGIAVPAGFEYEVPDVLLTFPVEYGQIDSTNSFLEIDLGAAGVDARLARNTKRVNTVEGYGSLRTPAGSYNEVLKMKTYIFNTDTTQFDTLSLPFSTIQVEYKWFAKGFSGPVFQASGLVLGGNEVIGEVRYREEAETSSVSNSFDEKISVFPNPVVDEIRILGMEEGKKVISIYDLNGRLLHQAYEKSSSFRLKTDLIKGIYFLSIKNQKGKVSTHKLIKL